jgi:hypothetical protein
MIIPFVTSDLEVSPAPLKQLQSAIPFIAGNGCAGDSHGLEPGQFHQHQHADHSKLFDELGGTVQYVLGVSIEVRQRH